MHTYTHNRTLCENGQRESKKTKSTVLEHFSLCSIDVISDQVRKHVKMTRNTSIAVAHRELTWSIEKIEIIPTSKYSIHFNPENNLHVFTFTGSAEH